MHLNDKYVTPKFMAVGGQKMDKELVNQIKSEIEEKSLFGRKQVENTSMFECTVVPR